MQFLKQQFSLVVLQFCFHQWFCSFLVIGFEQMVLVFGFVVLFSLVVLQFCFHQWFCSFVVLQFLIFSISVWVVGFFVMFSLVVVQLVFLQFFINSFSLVFGQFFDQQFSDQWSRSFLMDSISISVWVILQFFCRWLINYKKTTKPLTNYKTTNKLQKKPTTQPLMKTLQKNQLPKH